MGLTESRLPSRDQTVLCLGEDVVPAFEKLRLVDRLGEAISHHVVMAPRHGSQSSRSPFSACLGSFDIALVGFGELKKFGLCREF